MNEAKSICVGCDHANWQTPGWGRCGFKLEAVPAFVQVGPRDIYYLADMGHKTCRAFTPEREGDDDASGRER